MNDKQYGVLEAALAFMGSNNVTCRVSTICSLANSLSRGKVSVSMEDIVSLSDSMPLVFKLVHVPVPIDDKVEIDPPFCVLKYDAPHVLELEIQKVFNGFSKAMVTKRRKLFNKLGLKVESKHKVVESEHEVVAYQHKAVAFQHKVVESDDKVIESEQHFIASEHKVSESEHKVSEAPVNGTLQAIQYIKESPLYEGQIVYEKCLPGRSKTLGELAKPLKPELRNVLSDVLGINELYLHQAEGINAAREGQDVFISTSTSSGKSLVYNVPVFESIMDESCTGLYIFPTKALSQDQLAASKRMACGLKSSINIFTYDGDTEMCQREYIRNSADLLITNPDMLHVSMLPGHFAWQRFLKHLKYVVIDEAHTYNGGFGSHAANVFRRLIRVCHHYQNHQLQFICCSATIGNPVTLFSQLIPPHGNSCVYLNEDNDGSPCAERHFMIWNPPLLNEAKENKRKSAIHQTALLFSALVRLGIKTLSFCKTRKLTELVLRYAKEDLESGYSGRRNKSGPDHPFRRPRKDLVQLIAGYRGGYQVEERRQVEKALFSGNLRGVAATCALELGIDVGHLDCVIVLGYPGSTASLWQQFGRAGREGQRCLAIFVAFNGPLDQYFVDNPAVLLDKSRVEDVVLDPTNKFVCKDHLLCAISELDYVAARDSKLFSQSTDKVDKLINELVADGLVISDPLQVLRVHSKVVKPFQNVSLRMIDPVTVSVVHDHKVMDTIPYSRAFFEVYPGAIYMHQGRSFLIHSLDLTLYKAIALPTNARYFTAPRDVTQVHVLDRFECDSNGYHNGPVQVVTRVYGYRKMWLHSSHVFEMHEFTLPPMMFDTQAIWIDISSEIQEGIGDSMLLRAGIHGANHLLCKVLPLFVICHHGSLGTEHTGAHFKRAQPPRLLVYDNSPGGIGAADVGYKHMHSVLQAARKLVHGCGCLTASGCLKCILDPTCSELNAILDKAATIWLLDKLTENIGLPVEHEPASSPAKKRARAMTKAKSLGRARVEQIQIAKHHNVF